VLAVNAATYTMASLSSDPALALLGKSSLCLLRSTETYKVRPCSAPCRSFPAIWVILAEAFRNQENEELLFSGKPLWGWHG
jgi:hypothetical protein